MPRTTNDLLTLSNTQARELSGRMVIIGGATYYFKAYDPDLPGQPPWRTGAEGKAYPLVRKDGSIAAYLKFFSRPTPKRLGRTAWLIGQGLNLWLPNLAAAPLLLTDTRRGRQGARLDFDFAAYLAKAVPGQTWLECKSGIADGSTRFPDEMRWRCVKDLVLSLAVLEQAELVHGDLSPNNVIVDLAALPDDPMLYVIDYDAFVAPAAGALQAITVAEGGTWGTDGYCPPDLAAKVAAGDLSVAPYSDRCGRDMLLLEFLLMGLGLPADDAVGRWDHDQLQRQFAAWRGRSDPLSVKALEHLDPAVIFTLKEEDRPSSVDVAVGLGLALPERRVLRRVTSLPRPTPALLGRAGAKIPYIKPPSAEAEAQMDEALKYLSYRTPRMGGSNITDDQLRTGCISSVLIWMGGSLLAGLVSEVAPQSGIYVLIIWAALVVGVVVVWIRLTRE
jgi:hypothetical protein